MALAYGKHKHYSDLDLILDINKNIPEALNRFNWHLEKHLRYFKALWAKSSCPLAIDPVQEESVKTNTLEYLKIIANLFTLKNKEEEEAAFTEYYYLPYLEKQFKKEKMFAYWNEFIFDLAGAPCKIPTSTGKHTLEEVIFYEVLVPFWRRKGYDERKNIHKTRKELQKSVPAFEVFNIIEKLFAKEINVFWQYYMEKSRPCKIAKDYNITEKQVRKYLCDVRAVVFKHLLRIESYHLEKQIENSKIQWALSQIKLNKHSTHINNLLLGVALPEHILADKKFQQELTKFRNNLLNAECWDLHVHSDLSDGIDNIANVMGLMIARSIDGCCLLNHNRIDEEAIDAYKEMMSEREEKEPKFILGMEIQLKDKYKTEIGALFLNMRDLNKARKEDVFSPGRPLNETLSELIANNIPILIPHPFGRRFSFLHCDIERRKKLLVQQSKSKAKNSSKIIFEVVNTKSRTLHNNDASNYARKHNKMLISAGSDSHCWATAMGTSYVIINKFTNNMHLLNRLSKNNCLPVRSEKTWLSSGLVAKDIHDYVKIAQKTKKIECTANALILYIIKNKSLEDIGTLFERPQNVIARWFRDAPDILQSLEIFFRKNKVTAKNVNRIKDYLYEIRS